MNTDRFIVISGCSGAGKSTLLEELGRRDFPVVEEPGRRIVRQEMISGGRALPWLDPLAFARRAAALSLEDRTRAEAYEGWVFFDRGLVDACAALAHLTGDRREIRAAAGWYGRRVFLAPPWPELFVNDAERRHDFSAACEEFHRLADVYGALGHEVIALPKLSVSHRADFMIAALAPP